VLLPQGNVSPPVFDKPSNESKKFADTTRGVSGGYVIPELRYMEALSRGGNTSTNLNDPSHQGSVVPNPEEAKEGERSIPNALVMDGSSVVEREVKGGLVINPIHVVVVNKGFSMDENG
jgi:hypothetical protein